ncbi:Do family serine endopeptidase [Gluconacetobacter azotocaptans]|uniref:Probable periplasmic serine endoprotease DegP-like n=1 Tax=Gluconacetobacter azotocaptans TaxID=142834 RepID=A0A7W4JR70_9PROT|nr:Do family serine endopeptidase [Gluconacetobacter azotocaptans]MBB2189245.1 Do family serine endopeptidase [Gluconacetobacter azotocaptans]MBM9402132.1 Do family serine endopeptidase [Gluconacetobacter azotocaptans]GBQ32373.1 endopeptidase DegP/Do [Gluconacetobacter azotocaptans DSM 13594]
MSDEFQPNSFPRVRRLRAGVLAALVAGTALGGAADGALVARARADDTGVIRPDTQIQTLPNFVNLVKQVKPAVVSITASLRADAVDDEGGMDGQPQSPFPFPFPFQMMPQQQQRRTVEARGSGFIISADGFVVTNNHVVKGATKVTVTLDDGTTLPAKIVGRDPKTDLALLKVTSQGKLRFIELGDSDKIEPGEWVVAVGNPYGLGGTVTAGIVSARGRDIGDGPYDSFIQVDAPINRGNSGGPLFTQDGKVVGVNTAILSPSGGGSIGIGFAIPSDVVKNVVYQLEKTGHVTRGYLGVVAQQITPAMAKALGLKAGGQGAPPSGALVASVSNGSPAEKAGIKAGDVITALNGQKIDTPHDLAVKVASVVPGTKATLGFVRNSAEQTASVTIANLSGAASPDGSVGDKNEGGPRLGVSLSPLTPDLRQQLGLDGTVRGVVVSDVQAGSAAEQAGIHAGDVIQAVGNKPVENPGATVTAVRAALKANQSVLLRILRNGQNIFVAVTPGSGDEGDSNGDSDDNQ